MSALAPLSALAESACGIDGATGLLDFDVLHPPTDVLHLGTRLDIRVIANGDIGLDVRNRATGDPIFIEAPHGSSFYEVTPADVARSSDDQKVRVLETGIYAVILYIDYRNVHAASGEHGLDVFVGGRVRICVKGKPNSPEPCRQMGPSRYGSRGRADASAVNPVQLAE
jgi:hypothetical protein